MFCILIRMEYVGKYTIALIAFLLFQSPIFSPLPTRTLLKTHISPFDVGRGTP